MNIEKSLPKEYKGFFIRQSTKALILSSTDYSNASKIMKKDRINHLEINPNFYKLKDIGFLEYFDFIDQITILNPLIKDLTPVKYLNNLRKCHFEHKWNGFIDFQRFEKLEECSFKWGINGSETIFNCPSLTKLRIDNYTENDLNKFSVFKSLASLSLYFSNIENLLGIGNLKYLEILDLTGCSLLENIVHLKELKKLKMLTLDRCKRIKSLEPLLELDQLKLLSFNNIGKISTINYLAYLKNLQEVYFSEDTIIEDGDLNILFNLYNNGNLKRAIFKYRKHYSHRPEQIGYKEPDEVADVFKKK